MKLYFHNISIFQAKSQAEIDAELEVQHEAEEAELERQQELEEQKRQQEVEEQKRQKEVEEQKRQKEIEEQRRLQEEEAKAAAEEEEKIKQVNIDLFFHEHLYSGKVQVTKHFIFIVILTIKT
jgi:hypothetical protein